MIAVAFLCALARKLIVPTLVSTTSLRAFASRANYALVCVDGWKSNQRTFVDSAMVPVLLGFGLVLTSFGEEWIARVRRELPDYEARRIREGLVTGMVHEPLVGNVEVANGYEVLLAHAKLACYFDEVDPAEASFAKSAELNPELAATWHGLGRVRLGRVTNASEALVAATAFRRAASLEESLLPLMFHWTSLRIVNALGGCSAEECGKTFEAERNASASTAYLVCAIVRAVLYRVGEPGEEQEMCETLLSLGMGANLNEDDLGARLEESGYVVLKSIVRDEVHQRLLTPWYKHLFGRANLKHEALVAAGTAGVVIETIDVSTDHSVQMQLSVYGRWHPGNRRVELWGEPIADLLNHLLTPLVESALREDGTLLVPTYPWPIHYASDGMIDLHLDQSDNELSLSYQVRAFRRQKPSRATSRIAWPLHFIDSGLRLDPGQDGPPELPLDASAIQSAPPVFLRNNAGALYRGREVVHWRPPQSDGVEVYQLVFAWRRVDQRACHGSL